MSSFNHESFVKHDDYMTPKDAWLAIEDFLPKDKVIWEAFYGDGKSGEYLRELGCENVIHTNIDFYNVTPEYDVLISNPPFSDCKKIMYRLKELDKPFILIMPCSKMTTQYLRDNFINSDLQIIIPKRRIQFIKLKDGEHHKQGACNFDCFYYCYKMNLEKDITWLL
tara:strand:+ start:26 stop:526 length:501 start_codon:yes stop_codon:yes gene_type:complete